LWFTLRTHVNLIYNQESSHDHDNALRASFYKRIVPQLQQLVSGAAASSSSQAAPSTSSTNQPATADEQHHATTVALQDAAPQLTNSQGVSATLHQPEPDAQGHAPAGTLNLSIPLDAMRPPAIAHEEHTAHKGGHDAPEWSKAMSAFVLLSCTVLFSMIAGEYDVNSTI
jgi:Ca2+:H+ antiporter